MKRILSFLSVAVILSFVFVSCQKTETNDLQPTQTSEYAMGMNFLPAEVYNALPKATDPQSSFKATSFSLVTPTPGDQGSEGSCTAWGSTYAGRSTHWNYGHGLVTYSKSVNIFSPEYVYNQIKIGGCAGGSYTTYALDILKNQGVCLWNTMPYTASTCSKQPTTAQKTEAAKYKITSYATVSRTATSFKAQLNAGKIIVVGGQVDGVFASSTYKGAVLGKPGTSLGGHCYAVVGYDDTKGAFKVMNSWGTTWGAAGYGWISYTYMTSWWSEAYVLN